MNHKIKRSETVCPLFIGWLTAWPATVTSNWCVPETCCLPSFGHLAPLCWQSARSMFTPVGTASSGGCLWLHYAVKINWGCGVGLIKREWLDKWGWCYYFLPLLSFFHFCFYSPGFNLKFGSGKISSFAFFPLLSLSSPSSLFFSCPCWVIIAEMVL